MSLIYKIRRWFMCYIYDEPCLNPAKPCLNQYRTYPQNDTKRYERHGYSPCTWNIPEISTHPQKKNRRVRVKTHTKKPKGAGKDAACLARTSPRAVGLDCSQALPKAVSCICMFFFYMYIFLFYMYVFFSFFS